MRITVNGESRQVDPPLRLGELVDGQVADRRGVAVAVDGDVVPRAEWDAHELADRAAVEIVGAVQGG